MTTPTAPALQTPIAPQTDIQTIPLSEVTTQPLDAPSLDSVGLYPAARIGLPRMFWGPTPVDDLRAMIDAIALDTLPTALQLSRRVLLAEFASPDAATVLETGNLLTARIDTLIRMGALEEASQLIDAASQTHAALNARAFDIALLLGEEDRACASMTGQISAQDMAAAQVFCLARTGQWQAALAALGVSQSLNMITPHEGALLSRFLEEEEQDIPMAQPATITPLGWRIMEALGDPVTTSGLPVAFAYADLRGTSGWRAQLDAAERLTRAGVFQPNRLLGLYTQRRPAASGGVWERVRMVQRLDRALNARDQDGISEALGAAWPVFAAVELERAFAQMFAERLGQLTLSPSSDQIVWKVLLLAQENFAKASELASDDPLGQFVTALAHQGALPELQRPAMAAAIAAAFQDAPLPDEVQAQLDAGELGLVLLGALEQIAHASAGDSHAAQTGLSVLRALGLDSDARQIAIELLLLDRHG